MNRNNLLTALLLLGVAAPALAQLSPPPQDPAKAQVQTFEIVLRNAVDAGARTFAQNALKVMPFPLQPGDSPVVSGVFVRGEGHYYFKVDVPELLQTGLVLNQMLSVAPQGRSGAPSSRPLANRGVSSAGTVEADPMVASSAVSTFDPSREYTSQVSESLVDAVLENWAVLPIQPAETLVIIAGGVENVVPGLVSQDLYQTTARKLILTVKGADLNDFKAGKISRDDAKQRIKRAYF